MFVLNIDEIVFEACCPLKVKDDVEETEYKIPTFQVRGRLGLPAPACFPVSLADCHSQGASG